ncbi:MAG TPA: MaoC family dehydratase [Acetobacteraceae bacterium]|nr:MaoC family dehydratase [Acetobacteraceae bacterium]
MTDTTNRAQTAWDKTVNGRPMVGSTATRTRRTSMADIVAFSNMTGDRNPLHYDAELAADTPFGGLIVQGGVTSGLLNAIVAEDLPGPGTVFLGVEWRFVKAVAVGEDIIGCVKITSVREDKPICHLDTTVHNASGDLCLSGTALTFTVPLRRNAAETG